MLSFQTEETERPLSRGYLALVQGHSWKRCLLIKLMVWLMTGVHQVHLFILTAASFTATLHHPLVLSSARNNKLFASICQYSSFSSGTFLHEVLSSYKYVQARAQIDSDTASYSASGILYSWCKLLHSPQNHLVNSRRGRQVHPLHNPVHFNFIC